MQSRNETANWCHIQDVEKRILRPDISSKESQELYRLWAETGTYDKILGKREHYSALDKLRSAVDGLFPQPDKVLVLDVGAGTGLTAKQLKAVGYTNVHALEPNAPFAKEIAQKGLYKKIIQDFIGGEKPLDVADDTYDAIVTSGAFAPGHIPCSAVPEMLRIVKPGGYIVNCMREEYTWTVPEYRDRLIPSLEQLERQGRWKKLRWEIYPNHFGDKTGILMVYQVC